MARKAKFTPGPWRLDDEGRIVWGATHYPVISTGVTIPGQGFTSSERAEHDANARLIAAAPEMYEALCRVREMEGPGETDSPTFTLVRAVLQKVEGSR